MLSVGEVASWMDRWYPPACAASWDRVGLIVGRRNAEVESVLLAVDPVQEVLEQALELRVQMVITHHPLYLRGTSFVSEDDAKGRMVAELIRRDIALFNAHTNADVAPVGVAEALGALLGLERLVPFELLGEDRAVGYGRVGELRESLSLAEFAKRVASRLPAGPTGLLVGGDLGRQVKKVAVSGGSGDSFLALAKELGVDAYVTADLRHHPASEHLQDEGPALVCGSHWATEWPWLPVLAERLKNRAAESSSTLNVNVSSIPTEPWTMHLPTKGGAL
ncbi:Nif3-like dinuclear metal center hexameric protein [Actinomycetaceae bacterium MB13-C1-2]|nr:Nif3-like dinuclear metal center hexameric protein [Actinomycetaceae bacterium MB13-C1-2]